MTENLRIIESNYFENFFKIYENNDKYYIDDNLFYSNNENVNVYDNIYWNGTHMINVYESKNLIVITKRFDKYGETDKFDTYIALPVCYIKKKQPFHIFVGDHKENKPSDISVKKFNTNVISSYDCCKLSKKYTYGNSLLILNGKNNYYHVCYGVFNFKTSEPIINYFSPIGNNDVPMPYAISKNYTYDFTKFMYIKNVDRTTKIPYYQYEDKSVNPKWNCLNGKYIYKNNDDFSLFRTDVFGEIDKYFIVKIKSYLVIFSRIYCYDKEINSYLFTIKKYKSLHIDDNKKSLLVNTHDGYYYINNNIIKFQFYFLSPKLHGIKFNGVNESYIVDKNITFLTNGKYILNDQRTYKNPYKEYEIYPNKFNATKIKIIKF